MVTNSLLRLKPLRFRLLLRFRRGLTPYSARRHTDNLQQAGPADRQDGGKTPAHPRRPNHDLLGRSSAGGTPAALIAEVEFRHCGFLRGWAGRYASSSGRPPNLNGTLPSAFAGSSVDRIE